MEALLKKQPRETVAASAAASEEPPKQKARPAAPATPPIPPKSSAEKVLQARLEQAEVGLYDKFVSAMCCVNYVDVFACSDSPLSVCFESSYMFKSSNKH